jgi:hypothetical protein
MYSDLDVDTLRLSYAGSGHYDSVFNIRGHRPLVGKGGRQDIPVNGRPRGEGQVLAARQAEQCLGRVDDIRKLEETYQEGSGEQQCVLGAGQRLHDCAKYLLRLICSSCVKRLPLVSGSRVEQRLFSRYVGRVMLTKGQETQLFAKLLAKAGGVKADLSSWRPDQSELFEVEIGRPPTQMVVSEATLFLISTRALAQ